MTGGMDPIDPDRASTAPDAPEAPGDGAAELDAAAVRARRRLVTRVVDVAVVVAAAGFVFAALHPGEILSAAVPAGGDMGAHVWGPAFLRDHLLPDLRLAGWTPDWYDGFPAYQFYMVLPSLLIVALDVGLVAGWAMLLPLALGAGLVVWGWTQPGWRRWAVVAVACTVVVLGIELPYGTAFKLVTVSGLVTLPLAAYALGRLADLAFPGPALLAASSLLFLFDRNFTIYGGNAASTMAGEFAFSISLTFCLLYLGVVIRGLRTGRHRCLAAVLLALTGLNHLIPAFYALGATAVIALGLLAGALPRAVADEGAAALRRLRAPGSSRSVRLIRRAVAAVGSVLWFAPAALVRAFVARRAHARWLATVLPVGGLVSAFWVLPFWWQRDFVNDMGWEKLPYAGESFWKYLVPRTPDLAQDLRWVFALALIGLVLSLAFKVRLGWILAALVVAGGLAFVLVPQGRLWNARLLPFYYLCVYLLAAVGVSEVGRTLSVLAARDPERPGVVTTAVTAVAGALACIVIVGLPLRVLPFGTERADGSYSFLGLTNGSSDRSFVRSWARWNYTGYVGKDAYPEYRDIVRTMAEVGEQRGCGRAFWEYEKELNRYGTPMALMLLPHWTDGCIGSSEGLFFEASATTPFHFLTQVELSAAPSAAQRGLPYRGFDLDKGVKHLQLRGIRYYLATSVQATTAAREHPDLTEIATSGPWVVFEVADAPLVEPLANEPAVLDGVDDAQVEWVCGGKDPDGHCLGEGPAVDWYTDPTRWDVFLASSGPEAWQRVDVDDPRPEPRPLPPVTVSDVEAGTDRISFTVDEPGTPVLVKVSYFPNWRVRGAEGPYRVAPNHMVVIPTSTEVELTYGREPVEWVAYLLTALGIALAVLLARRPPVPIPARPGDRGELATAGAAHARSASPGSAGPWPGVEARAHEPTDGVADEPSTPGPLAPP